MLSAATATVTLLASGVVPAQTPASPEKPRDFSPIERPVDPERAKVERADEALRDSQGGQITDPTVFVKSAALGALAEIALAKLAQSKSQDAGVRSFAARMLKDFEAIRSELAAVAKRQRLDVPTSLVYEDEQVVNEGAEKSGAGFDAWYADRMLTEHQRAIALFQSAAQMDDTALAELARKTLPTLDEHLRMASRLRE